MGRVYLQLVQSDAPDISSAIKEAEDHIGEAINIGEEIGAKSVLGPAYLDLGLLQKVKGNPEEAKRYISEAIKIFEDCDADVYLGQAKMALGVSG